MDNGLTYKIQLSIKKSKVNYKEFRNITLEFFQREDSKVLYKQDSNELRPRPLANAPKT